MNGIASNGFKLPTSQNVAAKQNVASSEARQKALAKASLQRFEASMPEPHVREQESAQILAQLEKINSSINKKLQFVISHDSKQITVNVIDANTEKIIKVLPPKELQRLNAKLLRDTGFLLDEKI